jgi:hypothetical protein
MCYKNIVNHNSLFRIQTVEAENRQILTECLFTLGEDIVSENDDDDQLEIMDYEDFEQKEEDDDDNNNQASQASSSNRLSLNDLLNW